MRELSDENRQSLLRLSLSMICGGTALLPFTVPPASSIARAASATTHAETIAVPRVPGRLEFPVINIERDPFASDTDALPAHVQSFRSTGKSEEQIGVVLPPNAGAQGSVTAAPSTSAVPVVRGIVLGDSPQALVDFGTGVKVLSLGDRIGSESVRTIDATGLTLSSGVHIPILSTPR